MGQTQQRKVWMECGLPVALGDRWAGGAVGGGEEERFADS